MKRPLKYALYIALSFALYASFHNICKSKTDGFAVHRVCSDMKYNQEFATKDLSEKDIAHVYKTLDQPYYYLGKGAQCYAFISEDKEYVIKFFRMDRLSTPEWQKNLIMPTFLEKTIKAKQRKKESELIKSFSSYRFAFDELKEETGLIYIHLNKTCDLNKSLTIFDKINVKYTVDLDKMHFLIQKRADLFYTKIEEMILSGNKEMAREHIRQLVDFFALRSKLGYYDKDPNILTNFGICKDRTIQIDVGRYLKDQSRTNPNLFCDDIIRATDEFRIWLDDKDSELSKYLLDQIEKLRNNQLKEHEKTF